MFFPQLVVGYILADFSLANYERLELYRQMVCAVGRVCLTLTSDLRVGIKSKLEISALRFSSERVGLCCVVAGCTMAAIV